MKKKGQKSPYTVLSSQNITEVSVWPNKISSSLMFYLADQIYPDVLQMQSQF